MAGPVGRVCNDKELHLMALLDLAEDLGLRHIFTD